MKFVINIRKLISQSITAEQFLFLYLIAIEELDLLQEYLFKQNTIDYKDMLYLKSKGFIDFQDNTIANITITNSGIDFLDLNRIDHFIEELWKEFPSTTPKGRKLKQCSKKVAEALYNKCHENKVDQHEIVIKALKSEVQDRIMNGSLDYMQNIKTWLINRSYTAYIDEEEKEIVKLVGSKIV